ncbi:MAG: DUF6703 family protein, partial [Actinomycetota bacterium]
QDRPGQDRPGQDRAGQGRPGQGRPVQGQSGRPGSGRPVPVGTGRAVVEQRSATLLVYLRHLPGWALPLLLAALFVGGLAWRGWGGAAVLAVLALFIGWLGYLSWPVLTPPARIGRFAMVAGLLALAVLQAGR